MEQVAPFYAPHTGFGENYRTSAKFAILHPDDMFPQWVSAPRLSDHRIGNSHKVITQYHGRDPWTVTMRLWFPSIENLEHLDDMVGTYSTLRYIYGISKRVGGHRETILGASYLRLDNTLLASLSDERYEIDGACEATVTFVRLFVPRDEYVEPIWPEPISPILPTPLVYLPLLGTLDGSF